MWTPYPDDGPPDPKFHLFRVKAKKPFKGYVLSDQLTGTRTHFHNGRSRPHLDVDCDGCNAGKRLDWHGYLAVWNPLATEVQILEITAASTDYIRRYLKYNRTLRGAEITATRPSGTNTGRLHIRLTPPDAIGKDLPPAIDVEKHMQRIWGGGDTHTYEPTLADLYAETMADNAKNGHPSQAEQRPSLTPRLAADR